MEPEVGVLIAACMGTATLDLISETTENTEKDLKTGSPSVDGWVSWWFMQCISKPILANTVLLAR